MNKHDPFVEDFAAHCIIGHRFICAPLDPVAICDLALLLRGFDLYQELGEHGLDPTQGDVTVPHLVLVVQIVPNMPTARL